MVHNGIEYAMMQAYAEGWELLDKVDIVDNVPEIFASWRTGTVVRSWLLDLLVDQLRADEHLDQLKGYAEDSGEGRWTVEAAIENAVPMPAISASLFARFVSRQEDDVAMKAIAAMRNGFGGHAVTQEGADGTGALQRVGEAHDAVDQPDRADAEGDRVLEQPGRGSAGAVRRTRRATTTTASARTAATTTRPNALDANDCSHQPCAA